MSRYLELLRQEARLVILRLLAEAPTYQANSSLLQSALEPFALHLSRDQVHTEIQWLEDQGLLSSEQISTVVIATLTTRGLDVAAGRAMVPGVKKPGPKG